MKNILFTLAFALITQVSFAQDVDFTIEDFEGSFLGLCYIFNGDSIPEDKLEEMPLIAYELANNEITIVTETEDGEAEILAYDDLVYLGTAETQAGSKGLHYTIATEQENPETFSLIFWMDSDTDEKEFEIQYGESKMTFVIEVLEVEEEEDADETVSPAPAIGDADTSSVDFTYEDFVGLRICVVYMVDETELSMDQMEELPLVAFEFGDDMSVITFKEENGDASIVSTDTLIPAGTAELQNGYTGLKYLLEGTSEEEGYFILSYTDSDEGEEMDEYLIEVYADGSRITFLEIPVED